MRLGEFFNKSVFPCRENYRWLIESLASLKLKVERIADFGCGNGLETLLLMCVLNACEGVGIDKCEDNIRNAQDDIETIQNIILAKGVEYDAPAFLKSGVESSVRYYVRDITEPTLLTSDYYDIAFCNRVLYHIFLGDGENKSKAQSVVDELRRIVKPGGVVAMCEPTLRTRMGSFCADFKPFFEKANLTPVHIKVRELEYGTDTEYIYVKESL